MTHCVIKSVGNWGKYIKHRTTSRLTFALKNHFLKADCQFNTTVNDGGVLPGTRIRTRVRIPSGAVSPVGTPGSSCRTSLGSLTEKPGLYRTSTAIMSPFGDQ